MAAIPRGCPFSCSVDHVLYVLQDLRERLVPLTNIASISRWIFKGDMGELVPGISTDANERRFLPYDFGVSELDTL
jgi:hypothetical protein